MYLAWSAVTTSDLPIKGYYLWVDDGLEGDFNIVYDGSTNPALLHYLVSNLVPGRTYSFKVQALNINGLGTESAVGTYLACVAPKGIKAPFLMSRTETTFKVGWDIPSDDGGC